jgi:hypothetical protein
MIFNIENSAKTLPNHPMSDKKPLLEHQKQHLELAVDEISTPISPSKLSGKGFLMVHKFFC